MDLVKTTVFSGGTRDETTKDVKEERVSDETDGSSQRENFKEKVLFS